jgi:hypothetical protein
MAVPRPVLLALIGLGLLASVFLVMRSGSSDSVKSTATPAKPAVSPSAPAPAKHGKAGSHKASQAHAGKHPGTPAQPPTPKPAAPGAAKVPGSTLDGRVLAAAAALAEDKAVVFFFSKPGAADDVGARIAVKSLRGMDRVQIFDVSLDEVAAFRPMLSNVGVSQIPSTVIVRPGKKAVLFEGFVDAGTLRQNVADALR